MEKVVLSENELAQYWGVSPKTLQRWRTEGRGPNYLKLSKRVLYPLAEIRIFESKALHASTSEKSSSVVSTSKSNLLTAEEASAVTGLPAYMFTNKRVREAAGLPCVYINSSVRFDLDVVMNWVRRHSSQMTD